MKISSYLNFNGNCRQAFEFYASVLNGQIVFIMTWGEAPDLTQDNPGCKMPANFDDKIMHAQLLIEEQSIMGCDCPPQQYQPPQGMGISLKLDSQAEIERIYDKLAEDAEIIMPLTETFWAQGFTMFKDKFGVPWMLNVDKTHL